MNSDINIVTNYYFNGFHGDEIVFQHWKMGKNFKISNLILSSLGIFTYQKTDDGKKMCVLYPLPKLLCIVDGLPFRLGCCSYMRIAPLFIYSAVKNEVSLKNLRGTLF